MDAALKSDKPTSKCLQFALDQGFSIPADACLRVASVACSPVERLHMLYEYGAPWDESVSEAAVSNSLPLLQYCMENDCPYDDNILLAAVRQPDLVSLQYLVEERLLLLSNAVFSEALVWGQVESVKYLIDVGCPCEFSVPLTLPLRISDERILQCIQYSVEHGWPSNKTLEDFVFNNNVPKCQAFYNVELLHATKCRISIFTGVYGF